MKKAYVVAVLLVLGLFSFVLVQENKRQKHQSPPTLSIHSLVQLRIDSLQWWYNHQWLPLTANGMESDLQACLKEGRQHYKKMEWAVDFFFPHTAKEMNGPAVAEIEAQEHLVTPPSGFQVLEQLVFSFDQKNRAKLLSESKKWNGLVHRLQKLWQDFSFRDDQVWMALRFNLLRITSLSLAGFDTPLSFTSIQEIENNFAGIKDVLNYFKKESLKIEFGKIEKRFANASAYVSKNKDFALFDRVYFIDKHLRPIEKDLFLLQKRLGIKTRNIYAINLEETDFFEPAAFNLNYFTSNASSWLSNEKIALGKQLFYDSILSSGNTIACASCHKPDRAFTDGVVAHKSFSGGQLKRNTPTLYYAGLQLGQFYDMRALYLEDQVRNVVENEDEIHGSLSGAVEKLSKLDDYVLRFKEAFPQYKDSISQWQLQVALSSYIRSLTPFASKFDRFWQGKDALTKEEATGFNLFMGKAQCGSCHFLPLFNGTIPPMFNSTESEVIGVPSYKKRTALDVDLGRYEIHQLEELKGSFKTPTLRNIAATAPYMHNGVFQTLEEVLDFYNEGGGVGLKLNLKNQTLSSDKLNLSKQEKKALIRFLSTLTDKEVMLY